MKNGDTVIYKGFRFPEGKEARVIKVGMCTTTILCDHEFMIVPSEDVEEKK